MRPFHIATVVLALALASGPVQAQSATSCNAPDDFAQLQPNSLPHVAASLRPGATLNILAVGSANLFRPEASLIQGSLLNQSLEGARQAVPPKAELMSEAASAAAFPQQMAAQLEKLVPGLTVKVVTRGGRGLSAIDQLALLREAVDREKFQLVLWQTGTVEAVRNLPPSEFAQTLADGVEKATHAGADVVLVDPQFSRFLQTNSNIEPYEQAFQYVASMPGVALFHRFDLMRSWVNDGQIDLERTPKSARLTAVEHLHQCLGSELARLVASGARS